MIFLFLRENIKLTSEKIFHENWEYIASIAQVKKLHIFQLSF